MDMILTSLILWPVRRFAPAVAAIVGPKIVTIVAKLRKNPRTKVAEGRGATQLAMPRLRKEIFTKVKEVYPDLDVSEIAHAIRSMSDEELGQLFKDASH